ncbi:MAG: DUF3343 domain-containing protein [Lachnospiraceae bacterium]|nr:DUF3343 domain-containing protein [Lachnospiraceae bacterium]
MRDRAKQIVITFHTTADAMAFESACKQKGTAGRLIPVPRSISAGCGIAWAAPLEARAAMEEMLLQPGIYYQELHEA